MCDNVLVKALGHGDNDLLVVSEGIPGNFFFFYHSVQFRSVTQSCQTPCNPMNWSIPGLPVHHKLQEFTQTHVH